MTLPKPVFVERRRYARRDVNYAARVRFPGAAAVDCVVINVSAMGALIDFREPRFVPDVFHLVIPDQLFAADCEVRHRPGSKVGVVFTSNRREALARFG